MGSEEPQAPSKLEAGPGCEGLTLRAVCPFPWFCHRLRTQERACAFPRACGLNLGPLFSQGI